MCMTIFFSLRSCQTTSQDFTGAGVWEFYMDEYESRDFWAYVLSWLIVCLWMTKQV